jgi:hypothetical protein
MGYVGIHTQIKCRSLKSDSMNDSYHLALTKQNALFIKATTTCQPMVCHQHFNLIPFWLHCRMPLDRGQSRMSDWQSALFGRWQDLHDDDKTCMQSSYWELILENGQWLGCWITDGLCALPVTGWTGIHGFGYLSLLIQIAPFSAHKLIGQDTAVLHQAIIV